MDPGMPMMPDPSGGAVVPSMAPPPQIDPAKLAMIREMLLKRMMSGGQGMPMAPPPAMLGAPPRPMMPPTMIPGQPPFGGMNGVRG